MPPLPLQARYGGQLRVVRGRRRGRVPRVGVGRVGLVPLRGSPRCVRVGRGVLRRRRRL